MKTLFSVCILVAVGLMANFLIVLVLNTAGVPGALIAGSRGKSGKGQFILGSIISSMGQSYVYLGYTAFVVNWTTLAILKQGVSW